MFRRIGSIAATTIILLTIAAPASAKLPPFDTEVTVDGTTATITVRFRDFDGAGELTEDFLPDTRRPARPLPYRDT